MILCRLYWLFAAVLAVHLIAPSVVKGITQLPLSAVYSGPAEKRKKKKERLPTGKKKKGNKTAFSVAFQKCALVHAKFADSIQMPPHPPPPPL